MCQRLNSAEAPRALTEAYLFVMLTLFPLFTGFSGYANLTLSKFIFFVTTTLLWLAGLVFVHWRQSLPCPRPTAAMWCMLVFLALAVLSTLLSPHRLDSLLGAGRYDGLLTWLLFGAVFLGCAAYGRWRNIHTLGFAFAISLCCVVAVLQLMGYDPLWLYPGELNYYDGHVRYTGQFLGTIGNTNLLSSVLCLAIPFFAGRFITGSTARDGLFLLPMVLALFVLTASGVSGGMVALLVTAAAALVLMLTDRQRVERCLLCGAAMTAALAAAQSFSGSAEGWQLLCRGSVLLCLAVTAFLLAVFLLLKAYTDPFPTTRTLRKYTLVTIALLLLAGIALLWFWPGESGTVYELSQLLHGRVDERFGSSRIMIWQRTLELSRERPWLGSGPGTLALRLDIEFSRYIEETGKTMTTVADNAHNLYLQLLAENGLLGLAAYGAMLWCVVRAWRHKHADALASSLALAVLCYTVQSCFGLELCINAPLFWIFLGLCASDVIYSSDSED